MCPRGRPRGQGRPRGLHLWKQGLGHFFITSCSSQLLMPISSSKPLHLFV